MQHMAVWYSLFYYLLLVLVDILYFLAVFHKVICSSTQTAGIFGNQAISKCSYIRFLVIETIFRISLTLVLAIYNFMHVINHAVLVEMLRNHQMISKSLYTICF